MKEEDYIGKCPLSGMEDSCYITPINENYYSYRSLTVGFESSDFLKVEEGFDFEEYESTLPELYKDIKQLDDEGRVWYPQVVNIESKGIVFVLGTSKDEWQWASLLSVPVSEEEKERFKNPKTGEYIKFKNDQSTLQTFNQDGFIDALDSISALE